MKLRSGKTIRRTRSLNMNNLQGFHPLSPVPGTKVGEGTIAKDLKSIPEEATEEKHLDNSDNLDKPEDQGAAEPMPKAKTVVRISEIQKFAEIIGRRKQFAEIHNLSHQEHLKKWTVENFKAIGWLKRSNRFGVYHQEVILNNARKNAPDTNFRLDN
ncbi:unnamed protein product [Mytilus edulis]|uniref:Uncharacterized protein n=1 Tax=Mytilus edulis TaxID=6550 RepID=A0A8S3VMF2_MYTED|nr:unnamed protein product [Mytilus edulis]